MPSGSRKLRPEPWPASTMPPWLIPRSLSRSIHFSSSARFAHPKPTWSRPTRNSVNCSLGAPRSCWWMPSSVPPSSTHTKCRNPALVCSSSTGSVPSKRRYHGPLTSTSLTFRATWARPGKPGTAKLLSGGDRRLDDGAAASGSTTHIPQVALEAQQPQPARDHAVGEPQRRQKPFESALLARCPGKLHVLAELRRQKTRCREQVERVADLAQRPGKKCQACHAVEVPSHRRVDPQLGPTTFSRIFQSDAGPRAHLL